MFLFLRTIIILLAISVFAQAVMIGHYLSGADGALMAHRVGATVTALLALLQFVVAVLYVVREKASKTPVVVAGIMVVAVVVQMLAGVKHIMFLHVPLGVALFGGIVGLLAWTVTARRTPAARRARASEPGVSA